MPEQSGGGDIGFNFLKTVTDSLDFTGAITIQITLSNVSEDIYLADVTLKILGRTLPSDPLSLSDTRTNYLAKAPRMEVLPIIPYTLKTLVRVLPSEALPITDELIKASEKIVAEIGDDALSLLDTPVDKLPIKILPENLILSDSATKALDILYGESLTLSDEIIKARTKETLETISLSDTMEKVQGKWFGEDLTLSDELDVGANLVKGEDLTLSDVAIREAEKVLDDPISLSDIVTKIRVAEREYTENLSLADLAIKETGKEGGEALSLSDILSMSRERPVLEDLTLIGSIEREITFSKDEDLFLSDVVERTQGKWFGEDLTLSDQVTHIRAKGRVFNDASVLSDELIKELGRDRTESLGLADEVEIHLSRDFSEAITLTGSVLAGRTMTINEHFHLIDTVTKSYYDPRRSLVERPILRLVGERPELRVSTLNEGSTT